MKDVCIKFYAKAVLPMKNGFRKFMKQEDGLALIELVIILAIIISLALIFKNKIQDIFTNTMPDVPEEGTFSINDQ